MNLSYDINDALAVSFEAINLTGEDLRTRGRTNVDYWFIQELHPRYLLGLVTSSTKSELLIRLEADMEGAAVRSGPFPLSLPVMRKLF